MEEFKSFFKTVGGGEGDKCHYPTRLDTYGKGCSHNCNYCYARSLLDFRGLWNADSPSVADINKIRKKLDKIEPGTIIRMGGMTDCFQACEREHKVTFETIKAMNERNIGYLIVTKSDLVADDEYMDIYDSNLAHIQVTVTTVNDDFYKEKQYERAPLPSKRISAIQKLQDGGFDVAIRLSPIIEEYMDFDKLNGLGINNAVVEFLRINHWVKKWFDIDFSKYVLKSGSYQHLPLDEKVKILNKIEIPNITVCEDVPTHYEYWKREINPNPDDCCNLRIQSLT